MSLSFPNVSLLAQTHESRFFEAGFQYASFRRLTIQGNITDLPIGFGITGTWSGAQGLINTVANNPDYQGLILNGVNFGSGRVESMTFEPGNDVKLKGYQASLLIYDSGNLFNLTGGFFYSGVDTTNFSQLDTFTETYAFEHKANGGYSYTHDAAIKFISGAGQLPAIAAAQALAKTLFTGSNLGLAFYSGYTNKQGKRYYSEIYDTISSATTFRETFDFDDDKGNYSAIHVKSLEFDEQGVVTAVERGTIRGIENPNYQRALSALSIEITGSYLRCSGMLTNYLPSGSGLLPYPITQGRSIDIFTNQIGYTISFNNKPDNFNTYFWDYTQQFNVQNGIGAVTENGTIVGRGENRALAFTAAQAGYGIVLTGIPPRMSDMFNYAFSVEPTGYLANKQESYSPYQGNVTYTYQYSNDPALISNTGVRRKSVAVQQGIPVYAYNKVNIFNVGEIVQDDYQSTLGSSTTSVDMEGDKTVGLTDFLGVAVTEINARPPSGMDVHVNAASYTYNPNLQSANVQLTWLFNRTGVKTITL